MDTPQNQPIMTPAQQPAPMPPSPTPPKKTMSKKLLWTIIGSAIALVVVVLVLAITVGSRLGQPSKQDYQDVYIASSDTTGEYLNHMYFYLSRAQLNFTTSMSNVNIGMENMQNIDLENLRVTGEMKPYLSVDEDALVAIEDKERASAKKIAEKERKLDESVRKLGDNKVEQAYREYTSLREDLYGEGRTAEQYVESTIAIARIQYGCKKTFETFEFGILGTDDAREAVLVTEGCITSIRNALEGDVLSSQQKEMAQTLDELFSETSDTLIQMVDEGSVDSDALDAVAKKYESRLDASEQDESASIDALSDALYEFNDVVVDRRDAARGEITRTRSSSEGGIGVEGVRR